MGDWDRAIVKKIENGYTITLKGTLYRPQTIYVKTLEELTEKLKEAFR